MRDVICDKACSSRPGADSASKSSSRLVQVGIYGANRILQAKIPISKTEKSKTIELIGRSWAADATAFVIPELDIALDAGYPVIGKKMGTILLSHTHTDHVHHLTHMKSRTKPPLVLLPAESVKSVERFIDVAQMMTSNLAPEEYQGIPWDSSLRFQGVRAGERVVLNTKKGLVCDIVQCDHGVPCVGFVVSQTKSSLKNEFKGLPGKEIGKLRKDGVAVTEVIEEKIFCFLGDTTTEIFSRDTDCTETILSCPTVIIECSFLTDEHADHAERCKHVLWSKLKPFVLEHPDTTFVLTHFSRRWTARQVAEILNDAPSNVVPWIPSDTGLYCSPVGEAGEIQEIYSHS